MAWLQNLAGRAEDLLNKIDQNAATVLNESNNKLEENTNKPKVEESVVEVEILPEAANVEIENETVTNVPIQLLEDYLQSSSVGNQNDVQDYEKYKTELYPESLSSHDSSYYYHDEVKQQEEFITELQNQLENRDKELLNVKHMYAELRNESALLQSKLEAANLLVATAQSEMEQYKARAHRVLQEKEQLIQLKNENRSDDNTDELIRNYNQELKEEVEFQQQQNMDLLEKVKKHTEEVSTLQQQILQLQNASLKTTEMFEETLLHERNIRHIAEDECRSKDDDLQLTVQQLSKQFSVSKSQSEEIRKLKEALKSQVNFNINSELEIKVKRLTDTLMTKQSALETATTERNALRIQLEKLQSEYGECLGLLERSQVRPITINADDGNYEVSRFMRLSPFDAGVTRRVKHAYSSLDAISVRTGVFLRRYPVARVLVFSYMILLHLWALMLLFLYVPSNH